MKRIFPFVLTAFLATASVSAQEWLTDINTAKEIASKDHLPILLVFQGSDWCAPCIRLDREVWSTETFRTYADGHFVMLKADFPRKKKNALPEKQAEANARLAETYNSEGVFPLVVILDSNGKVLGKTSYKKMSPKEYIDHLESFKS